MVCITMYDEKAAIVQFVYICAILVQSSPFYRSVFHPLQHHSFYRIAALLILSRQYIINYSACSTYDKFILGLISYSCSRYNCRTVFVICPSFDHYSCTVLFASRIMRKYDIRHQCHNLKCLCTERTAYISS